MSQIKPIKFGDREIGGDNPPYIIAEIGSNHNGDMELAKKLIDSAKENGADAVKFQSWDNKTLVSKAEYERNIDYGDTPEDKHKHFGTLKEMIEEYYLREEQHYELANYCKQIGITFASSPFSEKEVDLLVKIGVPFLKVASMDVTNLPFLSYVGKQGLPVILSTGMSTLAEIDDAYQALLKAGCNDIVLLHCISIYPPKMADIHLNNIPMLEQAFETPVGFSDHSIGTEVPKIAMAMGACVIEKHFTLDKEMAGWDHTISANPAELNVMSQDANKSRAELQKEIENNPDLETIRGQYKRTVSQAEMDKRIKFCRCIVAKTNLKAGHIITAADLDYKRPGNKISPNESKYIIGRELLVDVEEDQEFEWDNFGALKQPNEMKKVA